MDNTIGFKIPHSIQKNKTFCLKRMLITIGTVRQKQKITRKTSEPFITAVRSCGCLRWCKIYKNDNFSSLSWIFLIQNQQKLLTSKRTCDNWFVFQILKQWPQLCKYFLENHCLIQHHAACGNILPALMILLKLPANECPTGGREFFSLVRSLIP